MFTLPFGTQPSALTTAVCQYFLGACAQTRREVAVQRHTSTYRSGSNKKTLLCIGGDVVCFEACTLYLYNRGGGYL